jgi:glycine/D-amino acid oxidase-like deaminating enzyme
MDLRSGKSLWQMLDASPITFPQATGDLNCEVLVLGGGITGALLGLMLARRGVSAIVVDKRQPGVGSTAASTGLLQYQADTPLVELIDHVGHDKAVHAFRRGLTAVDELEKIAQEVGGACQFARQDSLYFASEERDLPDLTSEYECLSAHGFPVRLLRGSAVRDLTSIPTPAAIRSRGNAQVDPYALTRQILSRAQELGLRVFSETEILGIEDLELRHVATSATARITAQAIVHASGYEAHQTLGFKAGNLLSTYALASEPLGSRAGWPDGCLIWETARPYFYGRLSSDGRAVIGGEDTAYSDDHTDDELFQEKVRQLERRWQAMFPGIAFHTKLAWGGTFGETKDGLAYVGAIPGRRQSFAALGYGGNGITFAMIAAKLIVSLYVGEKNPDEAVFAFQR